MRLLGYCRWLLPIMVGVLIGAGLYTFVYAKGHSYLSSDPKACVNCHIMREQYDGWQHASHHHTANCVDCHLPHEGINKWVAKGSNGFWHSLRFTTQDFHEPIRIHSHNSAILQANCVRCHKELVSEVVHAGHAKEGLNCVHCHSAVGHGPRR